MATANSTRRTTEGEDGPERASSGAAEEIAEQLPEDVRRGWANLQEMWRRLADRTESEPEITARAAKLCLDAEGLRAKDTRVGALVDGYQQEVCGVATSTLPECWRRTEPEDKRWARAKQCGDARKLAQIVEIAPRVGVDSAKVAAAASAIAVAVGNHEVAEKLADIDTGGVGTCDAVEKLAKLVEEIPARSRASIQPLLEATNSDELWAAANASGGAVAKDPFSASGSTTEESGRSVAWELARARVNLYNQATRQEKAARAKRDPSVAKAAADTFTCLGAFADSPTRAQGAKATEKQITEVLAEEARCRADPKCRAGWVAEDICGFHDFKAQVRADIADEKRYAKQVGVVNLTELQELKETLRTIEGRIADLKVEYRDLAGKGFSTGLCSG